MIVDSNLYIFCNCQTNSLHFWLGYFFCVCAQWFFYVLVFYVILSAVQYLGYVILSAQRVGYVILSAVQDLCYVILSAAQRVGYVILSAA